VRLKAVNNYIVTDKVVVEDQTINGLYIPDTQQKNCRWHKVTSVGEGAVDFNGENIPVEIDEEDFVYIQNHGQFEIEGNYYEGEDCVVASVNDVLVKYKDSIMTPLGNLIEIEKIEKEDQIENGLHMTKTYKYPSNVGRVIKLGLGWKTPTQRSIPFQVKEGDIVVYNPFAERTLVMEPLEEGKRYLISHGDIFGVVESN
jgi:co-chaperonin GroES (HSP10)